MADFIQDYLNRKALLWVGVAGGERDWIYNQWAGWGSQWMKSYQEEASGVREDSG